MATTRILIVDDSVVNRQMLKKCLSAVPGFEVVAVAHNGRVALAQIPQCNPDVVILDVEMPEMNGLETLQKIRELYSDLVVIMFSALTEKGAAITVQALAMGANDYVAKPNLHHVQDREELEASISHSLAARIQALRQPPPIAVANLAQAKGKITIAKTLQRVDVVGIGISTGGPNALAELLPQISEHFPVPILIVQHMPPLFTRYFAERLEQSSRIRVLEAEDNMPLEPHTAYIAPGNYHMLLKSQNLSCSIVLSQSPPENSCRPAVDVLFRSLASTFGSNTLGVIMTGMGQDGLRGCEQISEAGGQILAQDEASSTIWSMPGHVVKAGLADQVLPLEDLAHEIIQRVSLRR